MKALVLEVMDEVMEQPKEGVLGSDVQVNAFIGVPSEPFVYGTISGGFQVKCLQALNISYLGLIPILNKGILG